MAAFPWTCSNCFSSRFLWCLFLLRLLLLSIRSHRLSAPFVGCLFDPVFFLSYSASFPLGSLLSLSFRWQRFCFPYRVHSSDSNSLLLTQNLLPLSLVLLTLLLFYYVHGCCCFFCRFEWLFFIASIWCPRITCHWYWAIFIFIKFNYHSCFVHMFRTLLSLTVSVLPCAFANTNSPYLCFHCRNIAHRHWYSLFVL